MYNYYVSIKNNIYVYLSIYIFKNDFRVEKFDNWVENLLSLLTADTGERMPGRNIGNNEIGGKG